MSDISEGDWLEGRDNWRERYGRNDEERDALIELKLAAVGYVAQDGYRATKIRSNEEAADLVLDAGFRRNVEVTDEMVDRLAKFLDPSLWDEPTKHEKWMDETYPDWPEVRGRDTRKALLQLDALKRARAALEAALDITVEEE